MKVLLRETVEHLGTQGEIVDVKDGYARNYLLPRGLGVPATDTSFKQIEMERARIAKLIAKERTELEAARIRLESVSFTIVAAASPEGHLYGSVAGREIAEALAKEGFQVTEQHIKLEEPFKEVGVYIVPVALSPDLIASIRVWIVSETA